MTGGKKLALASVATLAIAACGGESGKLEIRSIASPLASGRQPVPFRIAEGRSYFALNNVGLALEAFRKALRDDPNSVDALNGIAACYDRMGRFDLSRRHYEMALAINPADPRLYANLAVSLDMQGKASEAASVRAEMTQRMAAAAPAAPAAPQAAVAPPAAVAVASLPAPAKAVQPVQTTPSAPTAPTAIKVAQASPVQPAASRSVTVALQSRQPAVPPQFAKPAELAEPAIKVAEVGTIQPAASRPVPVAPPQPPQLTMTMRSAAPARPPQPAAPVTPATAVKGRGSVTVALAPPRPVATPSGARLERLSSGQVALITTGRPATKTPVRLASSALRRFTPAPIVLLNAARHQGLAARTRVYLAQKGWRRIEIGNAPQVATRSVILYPASRRNQAVRLAGQFGFALRHGPSSTDRLTILLGRDAAARRWLRAKSA